MRTSLTFSVLFWIYVKRAQNNQTNIYARITVNGKKVNISLKHKVDIYSWDAKGQKVRGNSSIAREMNVYLDEVKSAIVQCYRDLKMEKRILTAELIKARYLGEDKIHYSMSDIFEYHNDAMLHKLKANTMGHYKTTQKHILTYLNKKYKTPDIYLENLDYEFVIAHIPNELFFKKAEQMLIDANMNFQKRSINRMDRSFIMDIIIEDGNQFSLNHSDDLILNMLRFKNSYDGSEKTSGHFGFYRKVCSNGLHVSETKLEFSIRHTKNSTDLIMPSLNQLFERFLDNEFYSIINKFDKMKALRSWIPKHL